MTLRRSAAKPVAKKKPAVARPARRPPTPAARPKRSEPAPMPEAYTLRMRKLSRGQVNQLARELLNAMSRTKSVMLLKERDAVLQAISAALADEFKREEEREDNVRRRLATMQKPPAAGSRDYEDLFEKLMEEEYVREGLDT